MYFVERVTVCPFSSLKRIKYIYIYCVCRCILCSSDVCYSFLCQFLQCGGAFDKYNPLCITAFCTYSIILSALLHFYFGMVLELLFSCCSYVTWNRSWRKSADNALQLLRLERRSRETLLPCSNRWTWQTS